VAFEQLVFASNQTTAFEVSQARGLVYLLCGQRHIPINSFSPTQIKLTIVGYGRAEKHQVQLMVKTIYNLKQIPKLDDTADALAIAYTGAVLAKTQ
jgi:crossover junction endodeoxyribonuclease RuvC